MRRNIASIQFLRFVAATLVVFFHTTVALHKYFGESVLRMIMDDATFGASGVHIFFVISGFIMVYTSFRETHDGFKPLTFAIRRLIRIYPIYFIYSALVLCFYSTFATGKHLSIGQFFGSIVLFPGYSGLIIGPGWTLSYEVYFYLCFGISMLLGLTRGLIALTAFFGAAIAVGIVFGKSDPIVLVFTNSLLVEFLFGAWIGYAVISKMSVSNIVANLLLVIAVAIFAAGILFGFTRLPSVLTWGLPSALLVAGSVFRERNGSVPALIKRLSFLGDSSYSLYLLHVVLIDAIILLALQVNSIALYIRHIGAFGMIGVCLAITVFCIWVAVISYDLIERTVVSGLKYLFRQRIAVVPASGQNLTLDARQ